jgi:multidrug efflux pump
MIISDTSIKRPVLTIVGRADRYSVRRAVLRQLPVREYPDTDVPTVSVTTVYRGASAEVVESRITEPLEEQLSAIDGIRVLKSSSAEEVSRITIEFNLDRNPDEAANDVRDRVSRARDRLPDEVNEPIIAKEEADAQPVLWLTFTSDRFTRTELTDLVDRIAKQRIQTVPGVGTIFIGGERRYAMRLWLDPDKLASYQLTAADVESALREQNVDIPAAGSSRSPANSPCAPRANSPMPPPSKTHHRHPRQQPDQTQGRRPRRTRLRGLPHPHLFNGVPTVGLGVVRQSKSNLLEVADGVKKLLPGDRGGTAGWHQRDGRL